METPEAVVALAALAQESRLTVFRLLVRAGAAELAAGQISKDTGIPPSALSFHLKELTQAGLTEARQDGRFVYYRARPGAVQTLVHFLSENCCGDAHSHEPHPNAPLKS